MTMKTLKTLGARLCRPRPAAAATDLPAQPKIHRPPPTRNRSAAPLPELGRPPMPPCPPAPVIQVFRSLSWFVELLRTFANFFYDHSRRRLATATLSSSSSSSSSSSNPPWQGPVSPSHFSPLSPATNPI